MNISVIIPLHNAEQYLRPCLDSVFNQTFNGDYEVICAVNSCTDSTLNIVKEYQQNCSNLKYIELSGEGVAVARAKAFKISSGEYIAFLDGDDYYAPNFLEKMYNTAKENNYDVVNCNFYNDTNGKFSKNPLDSSRVYDSVGACKELLLDGKVRGYLWTKLIKRKFFEDYKVYYPKDKEIIFEDVVTLYGVFLKINTLKCIPDCLYYYRNNPTAITKRVNPKRIEYRINSYACLRYLSDQQENKAYTKVFRLTYWRTWSNIFHEAWILRKTININPFKQLYLKKNILHELRSKHPLPIKGEPWEYYINECCNNN